MHTKRHFLSIAAMLTALVAMGQNAETASTDEPVAVPDTLVVVENAHNVCITSREGNSEIKIVGSGNDRNYYYSRTTETVAPAKPAKDVGLGLPFIAPRPEHKQGILWFNQSYIGVGIPVDEYPGIDPSIECGIGKIIGIRFMPWRKGPHFSFGVGIHYEKYTLHRGQVFTADRKQLLAVPAPEGATNVHNRIDNTGFTIPFTIMQPIKKDFGIAVGAELKLNAYTTADTNYRIDDIRYDYKFKQMQQQLFNVNLYGAIGWDENFAVYVRYCPTPLFKQQWGPEFKTISVGVTVGL